MASRLGLRSIWLADHDLIRDLSRTKAIRAFGKSQGVDVGFAVEITVSVI